MAATAVRYLRAVGTTAQPQTSTTSPASPDTAPAPRLRAVGPDERAPVPAAEAVDPAEFRRVLGDFASGVTVVTARAPATGSAAAGSVGFACQSFASLSMEPPLVSFMVSRTSTTWPRIARAEGFCVNVLTAEQAQLCRGFAVSGADKFAGVAHTPSPVTGSPLLAGVSAWIDCTIHAVHTGGDHLIVVGRVRALDAADEPGRPLVFHRGRFGTFAPLD
ncbi:flavin reductase family protein [Streptomyces sp. NHF165]|uniref:flavin reductase family protein n=1 Tax=Streptomyces sp. NHF165 TaxID=2175864 RepID=UPI00132F4D96|nr:flavin reductase family protein [Streptomyces sp. NHF165]QHF92928.1 NADPH-flavin oxidoreductase [Streptomyces sp. NHF165]